MKKKKQTKPHPKQLKDEWLENKIRVFIGESTEELAAELKMTVNQLYLNEKELNTLLEHFADIVAQLVADKLNNELAQ